MCHVSGYASLMRQAEAVDQEVGEAHVRVQRGYAGTKPLDHIFAGGGGTRRAHVLRVQLRVVREVGVRELGERGGFVHSSIASRLQSFASQSVVYKCYKITVVLAGYSR